MADRARVARALLFPLVAAILVAAIAMPFHSAPGVDTRSYIEMTAGVAKHGLPHLANGTPSRFPEMQARWNIARGDTLWGSLPPVLPYLAAPFLKLGGLSAVSAFEISLCAVLALAVFALGSRATNDPLVGTAAAYVVVGATPITGISFDLGPYILTIALFTWAMYFALRAIDEPNGGARFAAAAGFLGALAVGAHLATFTMFAAMMACIVMLPAEGTPPIVAMPPRLQAWLPTRGSLVRAAAALLGAAVPLSLVGAIDHMRFGSWNPISYGPCVWRSCEETGLTKQSVGLMLAFAKPTLVWALLVGSGGVVAVHRRSKVLGGAVVALAIGALAWNAPLRATTAKLAAMAIGFLIDANHLDLTPFAHAPDGLGIMTADSVLKGPLQNTPLLALMFVAPFATTRERRMTTLLASPCIALLVGLTLRANLPAAFALGYSYTHLRYVFPALPLAVVIALSAVHGLRHGRRELAIAVVIAIAIGLALASGHDDTAHWRRFLLLRVTLALAALAVVFVLLARRARDDPRRGAVASSLVAAAIGLSFAINLAVDLRFMLRNRRANDERVDEVAAIVPERFALVGWAEEIDVPLSMRASRDIEYADMYEAKDWRNFRTLIDVWTADDRPIFAIWPPPERVVINSPWDEIAFDPVGDPALRVVRVRKLAEDEQDVIAPFASAACPRPIHPDYCRGRCRDLSNRKADKHARRIAHSERIAFGTCGNMEVFAEDEQPGEGGIVSGIVEYFDDGNLVGATDTRAKPCSQFGKVPSCTPQLVWEASRVLALHRDER